MPQISYWDLVSKENRQIVIPVNQREYAQGRQNAESKAIRRNFVGALRKALLDGAPLSLDLIYGSIENGNFIPFDGQQRLTTLFLLHWLIAMRSCNLNAETRKLLHTFRYDLRLETEKFCWNLIEKYAEEKNASKDANKLTALIKSSSWYDSKWNRDPSVHGMITMLQDLDDSFAGENYMELWQKLVKDCPITFYYEEIDKLGTTGEELYITMNSRGKGLTPFEKFKPRFLKYIQETCSYDVYQEFSTNLDGKWLDFFWNNFAISVPHPGKMVDSCLFNFLWFFFDMLRHIPVANKETEPLADREPVAGLYERAEQALDQARVFWPGHSNIEFLRDALNKLSDWPQPVDSLFKQYFHGAGSEGMPIPNRISWYETNCNLLFHICQNPNESNVRKHMLLGFLLWFVSGQTDVDRLRHLRNLVLNSEDEYGNDSWRAGYLGAQLQGMSVLILNGFSNLEVDTKLKEKYLESHYNNRQLKEELMKFGFQNSNTHSKSTIIDLENHPFLRGNLRICYTEDNPEFGTMEVDKAHAFFFNCANDTPVDWSLILAALLASGAFEWWVTNKYCYWRGSLRLYSGKHIARRVIFNCQEPADRRSWSHESVMKIADWIGNASSPSAVTQKLNDELKNWLGDEKKHKRMSWIWYFVKYPELLPASRDSQGYYHWYKSPKSFLQKELNLTTDNSYSCNPFLWAVWLRSGMDKQASDKLYLYESHGSDKENFIRFPCGLTLRPAEFGWLVLSDKGNAPHRKWLQQLESTFPSLNSHGYLYISGTNCLDEGAQMIEEKDWIDSLMKRSDDRGNNYRRYDHSDRIHSGIRLAQKMYDLV